MIYLTVPNFINNLQFYNLLKEFSYENPTKYMTIQFQIESIYGNYPYSYWNGNINSNNGHLYLYPEIEKNINSTSIPLRINCDNFLLEDKDFYDRHLNCILQLLNQTGSFIELSNLKLLKFLQSNNYLYNYIYNYTDNNSSFDINDFYLYSVKNNNNLQNIDINKNKIELLINNYCGNCSIEKNNDCDKKEQYFSYNFYKESIFCSCPKLKNNSGNTLYNEILFYQNLGYNHFKIDGKNMKNFNNFLLQNLIKSEYINDCKDFIQRNMEKVIK